MKRLLRLTAAAAALLIVVLAFAACGKGIDSAKIDYGHSEIFSKDDMDEAIDLIKERAAQMTGLKKLINIRYSSDDCNSEENVSWMNECVDDAKFTQCIMFTTDFTTGSNTSSLNPNDRYTDWQWWLARTDGGEWHVVTSGYG